MHVLILLIKNNLVEPNEYHPCVNDCVLFRKDYKDLTSCPVCGNSRYIKDSQIPQKKFKYLPLLPRIRQMFSSYKVSQLLQCHLNQTDHAQGELTFTMYMGMETAVVKTNDVLECIPGIEDNVKGYAIEKLTKACVPADFIMNDTVIEVLLLTVWF